jgi:hypothetical protein
VTNPTYFTVTADYRSVVADLPTDFDYDPQVIPITANVKFTPVLATGDVILATDASPRPIGFVPAPISAQIDTDGRLKLRRLSTVSVKANLAAFPVTGDANTIYYNTATNTYYSWNGSQYVTTFEFAPVRLLADTALLELATPLYYQVTFSNVMVNNVPGSMNAVMFQAPTADVELNLIEVGNTPGQPAVGITKIAPGAVRASQGNLIFSFGGVDIPDPVPYANVNVTMVASDITDSTAIGQAVITSPTAAAAITTLTGTQVSGRYLRSNGTTAALAAIVAADVPTLNQSTTGSAATLTTGRTVQTSLSSTTAATFNGSANITPGVTGTLPVGNGGTGVASLTGLVKGTGTTAMVAATAGTDYTTPTGVEAISGKTAITSTGAVTGSTLVSTVATGTAPITVASTTNVANLNASTVTGYAPSQAPNALGLVVRDSSGNVQADNFICTADSTVTSAGSLAMTAASGGVQVFTGSSTHTVLLPTTTAIVAGMRFVIINQSTGALTVQSSAANFVSSVPAGYSLDVTALQTNPTAATHWRATVWAQTAGIPATTANTLAAFSASTSAVIGVGQIELGHASDTSLTRTAAGAVAVEGNPVGIKVAVPALATSTGVLGQWAADASWLYICTAANTWRRVALATW